MTRINVDLSDLLAPIRQMREEIQKMNEALRSTVQLQAQMAAHQRQAANSYSPTSAGAALQIKDLVAARGGPTGNVYSINTGSPVPPSNINPTGNRPPPAGIQMHRSYLGAQETLFRGGIGIAQAFASQTGLQTDLVAKREREEAVKLLSNSSNTTAKILLDVSKKIEQERNIAAEALKKATEEYGKASESGARNIAKFAKELDEAAKKFNKVNDKAEQFSTTLDDFIKKGGGGGDGGGRGGFGGWWDKFGGKVGFGASAVAGTAALGFQLGGAYANVQAIGFQQSLQAMQAIPQNIGMAESLRYQKYMAVVAPTTGEQMLEAYGNLLTPSKKKFSYLGVGNRQSRETEANKIFEEEFKASEAERKAATRSSIGSAIGQAALSIGAIVGGIGLTAGTAGVGALPGLALAGAGITGLVGAGRDLYTNITGAQTGLAGQKEGGIYDMPGAGLFFDKPQQNAQAVKAMYQSGAIRQREQNERMLIEAEKSRFDSRRLAMGLDENLAAMRMRTAATSMAGGAAVSGFEAFKGLSPERAEALAGRYAKLGYSIPEVGNIYNTYAGMMGTTKGADRLLGLSRAGVGSVEQMASNVLGISAVSGKQGDTKQLENIFAKAFEAGLKGAPAIQRFSQAAMEMSQALKIQSATGAAGFLSTLTGAMAGKSGSAMMYMDEARSGLMGLAGATGATTGLMGTLKVLSGAASGLGMGTGLGTASRSNIVQVQEALGQLSEGGDYTKLTGMARKMVGAQVASGVSPAQAMANVRRALEGQAAAQAAPFAAEYERRTGASFSSVQSQAKKLLELSKSKDPKVAKKAAEDLRNLMFKFEDETVGMSGLEAEGSSAALLMSGVSSGDFKRGKQILEREKGKGAAKAAADFATVNYKRVLNSAAVDAAKGIDRTVSDEELKTTAAGMGIDTSKANWKQELGKAAGVDVGKGEKFTFAKLATAMSTYADKDTQRTSLSIIEAFGPTAVQQLADAVGGTPAGGVMPEKPSVNSPKTPQQIQQEKNRARTRSAVGGMMP